MRLEYTKWGNKWMEALPLGNGHMGAMVYGNPVSERIELSENTFFSGEKSSHDNKKNAAKSFYKMRELLLQNEYAKAREESEHFIGSRNNYGTNLPVAACCIQYQDRLEEGVSRYCHSLCLEEGIINTTFIETHSGLAESECFLSHKDKLLVYHAKQENKFEKVIISLDTYRSKDKTYTCKNGILFDCFAYETMHSDGSCGVHLKGQIQIDTDGKVMHECGKIAIRGGSYFTIFIKMKTNFRESELSIAEKKMSKFQSFFKWDAIYCFAVPERILSCPLIYREFGMIM